MNIWEEQKKRTPPKIKENINGSMSEQRDGNMAIIHISKLRKKNSRSSLRIYHECQIDTIQEFLVGYNNMDRVDDRLIF